MKPHLLVDECLSERLPAIAFACGIDATHITTIGLGAVGEVALLEFAALHDMTLVTANCFNFATHYARHRFANGLVLLKPLVRGDAQVELFSAAVEDLRTDPNLAFRALDVTYEGWHILLRRYWLP